MKSDYKDKVFWITGASSGIGKALALGAARRGARLVLSARRRGALEAVRDEIASLYASRGAGDGAEGGVAILDFDLSDAEARARACEKAPSFFGRVDVLVLNAGMSQRSTFAETSPEAFAAVMGLDFEAPVDLVRRLLPAMAERGEGCLVAVSSFAGLAGSPLRPAYSAAKHAMSGLFQCLRSELIGSGIRVVTVYPGYVRTGIARSALGPSGAPTGVEDPNIAKGADPAAVARRILDSVSGGPVEIKLAFGLKSRFGLLISRHAPMLWASLSAKHADLGDRGYRVLKGGE